MKCPQTGCYRWSISLWPYLKCNEGFVTMADDDRVCRQVDGWQILTCIYLMGRRTRIYIKRKSENKVESNV